MSFTEFPSRLLENAVNEFASLPGIGQKNSLQTGNEPVKKRFRRS